MTQYDLSRVPLPSDVNNIQYDKSASRTLPIFSLDSGLVLERKAVWFNQNITQTLEPRVYYAHIPYKDQSTLWNFDSALADLDFSRIYSENLFTGNDRIAQADQLTAGATSRILARDTGEELFQFSLAQRYYFSKQSVNLSGALESNNAYRKSDILAAMSGKVANKLWAQAFTQYNSDNGKLLRLDGTIRWQPAYRKVFNLGYHQNKILTEPSKTAYASVQWPVPFMSNNLYAVSRLNYNLNNNRVTDAWAGFEYVKDCWILRLVAQRTVTTANRVDNTFYLQLELKGLGNIGNQADQQLNSQIDGYHAVGFETK
jgi:LPS-assembly protein